MAIAYCRTSVWREGKVSIEAQKELIQEKIGDNTKVTYLIDRGFSGVNPQRPAYQKLQEWVISSNTSRILYVARYDRLSRNVKEALEFLELCQRQNVEVVAVLEPLPASLGDKKASQLLFVQILFSLAEFTRSTTIENINNSLGQKRIEKKLLNVKVPFGYSYHQGQLIPDEKMSFVVCEIFKLYTTTKMGYGKIAKEINQQKMMFNNNPFKSYHIAQIIKNPTYMGLVGKRSKQLDSYISSDIVPIIDEVTYRKATQKRLVRTNVKVDTRIYPLRKKLICPKCGKRLVPRMQVTRGNSYHYYVCQNESCGKCLINAEKIETETVRLVSHYLSQSSSFNKLIKALEVQIEKINQVTLKTKEQVTKQKQILFQQFEQEKIDSKQLKQQLEVINQQCDRNQIKLSQEELRKRLSLFLKLSNSSSKEVIWPYIEQVTLTKEKQLQEVIIYGISIQSTSD